MRRHNRSEKRTVETGNAGGGWSRESKRGSHLHIADRGRVEAAHKSVEIRLPPGAFFGKRISSCCWKVMRAAATALVTAAAITSSRLAGNCGAVPVEGPAEVWGSTASGEPRWLRRVRLEETAGWRTAGAVGSVEVTVSAGAERGTEAGGSAGRTASAYEPRVASDGLVHTRGRRVRDSTTVRRSSP